MCLPGVERGFSGFAIAVFGDAIPQHPRALGVGRRSRREQRERDEQRGPSQSHHHCLPSSALARLTLTFSYAPHILVSVTPGAFTRWTPAWGSLPPLAGSGRATAAPCPLRP